MIRLIKVWITYIMPTVATCPSPSIPFCQVVENGVDDKPFFQYHDNTACKADYQSCALNVLASVQKQFDQFVGSPVVGDAGCQSEGEEQVAISMIYQPYPITPVIR